MADIGTPAGTPGGAAVIGALAKLPGGRELLEAWSEQQPLWLVGGAVRDLLLGRAPRELDVSTDGDAEQLARGLAAALDAPAGAVTVHERFGTASVQWQAGRIDVARLRSESYSKPGALPLIRPGTPMQDLQRRDFTVNAIAVAVGGPQIGDLESAPHALEDLQHGVLRVLHERSFLDDPTRLLRLARYSARLGFSPEPATERLAGDALAAGALETVSLARIGAELRLAVGEADGVAALSAAGELGVLAKIGSGLSFRAALAESTLALLPPDGRREIALMAALLCPADGSGAPDPAAGVRDLLDRLEFNAADRELVRSCVAGSGGLVALMRGARRPSELTAGLAGSSAEAVSLAGALASEQGDQGAYDAALRWLGELRHLRLQIGGDDLLAAGVRPGPEVGSRLAHALAMLADGRIDAGRESELAAALEMP